MKESCKESVQWHISNISSLSKIWEVFGKGLKKQSFKSKLSTINALKAYYSQTMFWRPSIVNV